jgi:hypothetical protein
MTKSVLIFIDGLSCFTLSSLATIFMVLLGINFLSFDTFIFDIILTYFYSNIYVWWRRIPEAMKLAWVVITLRGCARQWWLWQSHCHPLLCWDTFTTKYIYFWCFKSEKITYVVDKDLMQNNENKIYWLEIFTSANKATNFNDKFSN